MAEKTIEEVIQRIELLKKELDDVKGQLKTVNERLLRLELEMQKR